MAQELSTVSRQQVMPPIDPATSHLRHRTVSTIPSDPTRPVSLVRALSAVERAQIHERLMILRGALGARDERSIERSVAGMMLGFPSGRASGDEARAVVAAYTTFLANLPPWAVSEAAKKFARRGVPDANPAFPPSSAELHETASAIVATYQVEAALLERMLTGEVSGPIPVMSRERKEQIEAEVKATIADASLRQTAAELGIDYDEAMRKIPDAPERETMGCLPRLRIS